MGQDDATWDGSTLEPTEAEALGERSPALGELPSRGTSTDPASADFRRDIDPGRWLSTDGRGRNMGTGNEKTSGFANT